MGSSWASAQASNWPTKPVRFLVPFAPGGTSEIVARSVAAELTKGLGQSVFVENKPGGAGTVAMVEAAKSVPDGHTLILGHVGTLAVNPYMLSNQPYDVNKDFMPVTLLAKVPNVFVIHPDVPAKTFQEFIAYAKKNPGKLDYGSAGNASAGHLAMEYLKLVTGISLTTFPTAARGRSWPTYWPAAPMPLRRACPPWAPTSGPANCVRLRWAPSSASQVCPTSPPWRKWASKILKPPSGMASWCPLARLPMW